MATRLADYRFLATLFLGLAAFSGRALTPSVTSAADGDEKPAAPGAPAKPEDDEASAKTPARFITVSGAIEDSLQLRISNTIRTLQNEAVQRDREAVLVLEITRGESRFGMVTDIAKVLTSAEFHRVRTVAWIPERLDGNNVIVALACKEIIMHPDAEIGDIGRGEALAKIDQQTVLTLVEKRHNPKMWPAIAAGMMDPQKVVVKVSTQQPGADAAEISVLTREELELKRQNQIIIRSVDTFKEAGDVGIFSASKAQSFGVIVSRTAEQRGIVAEVLNLPRESLHEDPTSGDKITVRLIRVEGVLEPVLETFLERQINRAVDSGANLIIFEIDSPGGLWETSHNLADAIARLDARKIKTVAWIPKEAISGAALISLACDEIYLEPHARFGNIIPIEVQPGMPVERAPEKILSMVMESLRDIAERKGRSPALAMAMADKDLEVFQAKHKNEDRIAYMTDDEIHAQGDTWIKGAIVPETRGQTALTINGTRAHELKLAERPVADFDELKKRLGVPANQSVAAVERTWVDDFVFFLNSGTAMFLLLVIGIVCLYMELHLMTGLLGIISAVCFALFFWSRFLGGTAGWLEVMLFLLGIACIGIEIFVMPGFGVFGISGGLLLMASLIMASQTFGNIEPGADMHNLSRTVGTLALSIAAVVVIGMVVSRYLPNIPFLNQMILTPPGFEEAPRGPRLNPTIADGEAASRGRGELVGKRGVALSMLRPAGKAEVEGQFLDVVTEGAFLDSGSPIEIVRIEGNRVIVRNV